jgi:uncharacterized protein
VARPTTTHRSPTVAFFAQCLLGACCKLGPLDSRPDLDQYLTPEELRLYTSMIAKDDWCINFDKEKRMCKIYDTRPDFCRVDPVRYKKMFDIDQEDFSDFCRFCCKEQISDVYGESSKEMKTFDDAIALIEDDDDDYDDDGEDEGDGSGFEVI